MLSKTEAAERLGVKTRTLELYVQQGKLSVRYGKGQRGRVAQFDEAELGALKAELEQQSVYPQRGTLVANPANGHANIAKIERGDTRDLAQLFGAVLQAQHGNHSRVAITDKLMLTLQEASELSGVSEGKLRDAVRAGKLKAVEGLGRGYRVKRLDLDAYVKKL